MHKQNCEVLTQNQTNTNPMSFSSSQKRKVLLCFTLLVTAVFVSGGFGLLSAGDGPTGKQSFSQTCSLFVPVASPKGLPGLCSLHPCSAACSAAAASPPRAGSTPSRGLLLPPLPELPGRSTQSPVHNLLTARNVSNYNSYCTYLMTVYLYNFIRSYAYFMLRAAAC